MNRGVTSKTFASSWGAPYVQQFKEPALSMENDDFPSLTSAQTHQNMHMMSRLQNAVQGNKQTFAAKAAAATGFLPQMHQQAASQSTTTSFLPQAQQQQTTTGISILPTSGAAGGGLHGASAAAGTAAAAQAYPPLGQQKLAGEPLPATDKFGLLGLLNIIRMTDTDMNALALGTDLTTLGLNLNSPDVLYATFVSPFSETPHNPSYGTIEPEYHLPACYTSIQLQQPASSPQKIASFSDETLFYIFYSMPRDITQEAAANELFNRNWRYHKDLRLWLTKDPSGETVLKTATSERSTFIFFDVTGWEKVRKEYTLYYESLEDRSAMSAAAAAAAGASTIPSNVNGLSNLSGASGLRDLLNGPPPSAAAAAAGQPPNGVVPNGFMHPGGGLVPPMPAGYGLAGANGNGVLPPPPAPGFGNAAANAGAAALNGMRM
ncbi:transcriptional regulator [Sorochytrium milnesiophthora]